VKRSFRATTVALFVLGAALSDQPSAVAAPPVDTERFFVDPNSLPFLALPGLPTARYWGITDGAGWRIEVPDNWNGDLVLYAHGYAGTGDQLFVQNPAFIRAHLIANGYAWAASSYRANGYVPGTGAEDTHDLVKIFRDEVGKDSDAGKKGNSGKPNRVYVYGVSMGGHVVGHMIEKWPNAYAGALPICGVMGDNELFDFFQDMYLVAETLVGHDPIVPTPADYYTNPAMGWQVTRTLLGTPYPSVLTPAGIVFKQVIENLSGGDRPVFDQGWVGPSGGDLAFNFRSAVAGSGRENADTIYQFDTDPELSAEEQLFNDTIIRLTASTQERSPQGIYNETTSSPYLRGNFRVPVLTLHTLGELFVPFHMEQIYARRAIDAGNADLLVQRAIRGRGHCEFLPAEVATAFEDLVNWVVDGVKPPGDDILNPAVVAAPNFGCQFTPTAHDLVPPCP
jgi:pimeloyl-ACP methyl ester carboxylesterase